MVSERHELELLIASTVRDFELKNNVEVRSISIQRDDSLPDSAPLADIIVRWGGNK